MITAEIVKIEGHKVVLKLEGEDPRQLARETVRKFDDLSRSDPDFPITHQYQFTQEGKRINPWN